MTSHFFGHSEHSSVGEVGGGGGGEEGCRGGVSKVVPCIVRIKHRKLYTWLWPLVGRLSNATLWDRGKGVGSGGGGGGGGSG